MNLTPFLAKVWRGFDAHHHDLTMRIAQDLAAEVRVARGRECFAESHRFH
jgi:hypothetical protein